MPKLTIVAKSYIVRLLR